MPNKSEPNLHLLLAERYSDAPVPDPTLPESALLASMAARGSCRAFQKKQIPSGWVDVLCATALASPTKSDLQQRDIILLKSEPVRRQLASLVPGQAWVADAPVIAVFCGNNRRQRLLHEWHNVPFANDHLDAFFNATADAAIAMGAFVTAAEALGLGCCPISAVRNEAASVSALLDLPDHVFPFAGLAFGFPAQAAEISKRLPLRVTCHVDTYQERNLNEEVTRYDARRAQVQPYASQRFPEMFPHSDNYGWSLDKARQYSQPERADFGAYIRRLGFTLD